MRLDRALEQISEIHGHLDRGEVYRGIAAGPVACTGILGFAAAAALHYRAPLHPPAFVAVWVIVAVISSGLCGIGIARRYFYEERTQERRRTRRVLGQIAPAFLIGGIIAFAFTTTGDEYLLPSLWAMLFGLAIFSARPYLPRAIGWIGLFYLMAGAVQLFAVMGDPILNPWGMGITFGAGQLLVALVLHWDIERGVA